MHIFLKITSFTRKIHGYVKVLYPYIVVFTGFIVIVTPLSAQKNRQNLFDGEAKSLSERWELDSASRNGTFNLVPYKPIYVLLGNWSSNPNIKPQSENPDYSVSQDIPLNAAELKFQLSLKTKVLQGIFGGHGDLWVAYTQSSRWQLYNTQLSRAFRETNYEPEAMLTFATRYKLFGMNGRMLGISFNHQSNGRALPLSRSWNRIVFQAGFEKKDWTVLLRPWVRLNDEDDENPAIEDFTGRADLLISHALKGHQFSLLAKHSLRFGNNSHGSLQFDWALPISGHLKGHLQVFHGYGESMIDYNHKQTTIGLGVSLIEWQ
jgi:phospholipase A1